MDVEMVSACTGGCRTVRGIAQVLVAYAVQVAPVDRAEAWRRADTWFARAVATRL